MTPPPRVIAMRRTCGIRSRPGSTPPKPMLKSAGRREGSEAMRPFKTGGVYLNFEPDEGEQHVRAGFSPAKYARLVELKDKYDPENLFRLNQNIAPSGAAR